MTRPLVSVVIAAWNAADYLAETLEAAVNQTSPDVEIILVDDGSTDATRQVAAQFGSRVRYEWRPHNGLAAARNAGIDLVRGEYVALLDSDDLWHADKLATQVAIAARHPESGLIASDGVEFDGDLVLCASLLGPPFMRVLAESPAGEVTADFQHDMIASCQISCPSQVMFPRRVLHAIGPFADSPVQDYDYYLRLSRRYPITLHHHKHTRWRYRADSMAGPREQRWFRWELDIIPVLTLHRAICRPEDRELLESRITSMVIDVGYELMRRGRDRGRLAATRTLASLLGSRQRMYTLKHLAGLWTPLPVYRAVGRLVRGGQED